MIPDGFIVFPAIDLRQGQVVRLQEGDPNRQTVYGSDPAAVARRWLEAGARWLHVVNLDGAFEDGDDLNRQALNAIAAEAQRAGARIQFGGGLRSLDDVAEVIRVGVDRAIVGTLALRQPDAVPAAVERWGSERIAASIDARDGFVRARGWVEGSSVRAVDLAADLQRRGLAWLVFTDIARDGLQTGLNLAATAEMAALGLKVIASGGVASLEDINASRRAGFAGAIIGRALYEGTVDVNELFIKGDQPC